MVRENTRNISNSIEEQNKLLKKQSRKIEASRKKTEQISDIKSTLKNNNISIFLFYSSNHYLFQLDYY